MLWIYYYNISKRSIYLLPSPPTTTSANSAAMAPKSLVLALLAPALLLSCTVLGHADVHQKPVEVDEGADWATRHLAGTDPPPFSQSPNSPSRPLSRATAQLTLPQKSITSRTSTPGPSSSFTTSTTTASGTSTSCTAHTGSRTSRRRRSTGRTRTARSTRSSVCWMATAMAS